jgi:hypothetical protein
MCWSHGVSQPDPEKAILERLAGPTHPRTDPPGQSSRSQLRFSETRTGGAFTFMTGIGGFLQEFLYGYTGMRWRDTGVQLAPSLTSQIGGIVLHGISWRGRTLIRVDRSAEHHLDARQRSVAARHHAGGNDHGVQRRNRHHADPAS